MKKLIVFLMICMMLTPALAEGVSMTTSNYAMYSTASEIIDGLGTVTYAPDEGTPTLTIGDVTITAQECATAYIDGDNDVFTIPVNVMMFASLLGDQLAAQDPNNNDTYQSRIEELIAKYSDMDKEILEHVSADTVITCEDGSMAYFAAEYGVTVSDSDGIALRTYDAPSEEEQVETYYTLMSHNVEALSK